MKPKARKNVRKVAAGLGKAVKAHTAQRKLLKAALKNGGPKKRKRVKSLRVLVEDYIRMRILETPYQ